tara:strand:+ start:946 stop:1527 length:582 start_codon:yes stop_codon:yes gene_type:complete
MVFNAREVIDIILMTLIVGFIFYKVIEKSYKHHHYDPLKQSYGFDKELFKKAIMIAAPAIILHEFGHKFVALGYGATAEFHAAYTWLILGLILAALNTGIIFFVPAFVSILGALPPLSFALIALAGPAVNGVLWGFSYYAIKNKLFHAKHSFVLHMTKQVNMFLFFFNMLPIPGFDGFQFYRMIFLFLKQSFF